MKIGNTSLKATGLSALLFWLIILADTPDILSIPVILFSMIPIFLCCLLTIVFSVFPFYWFLEGKLSPKQIFNIYFPYYSIICFIICAFCICLFNFDTVAIAFFSSAFFTLLQAWVWNSKTEAHENL